MWKFVVDESMPRSTARELRRLGYWAEDVRDVSLKGSDDDTVFSYAQAQQATLVTADRDFEDIRRFPLGTHHGIIVVRVPDILPTWVVNAELLKALKQLHGQPLKGVLVIVELGRIRVRRQG
jgi:predicted nuclease of predicted toxin-antitoxin system